MTFRASRRLTVLVLAALCTVAGVAAAARSFAGSEAAPPFPAGLDWLNTRNAPLTLAQLRGKVVLLDFWTFGCANCMHVIPDLKKLEAKYARELVVIGVHSAKFPAEGRTAQIRKIVQRYEIGHPVVNDAEMQVWNAHGVQAWPTFVVIDPAGNTVGATSGEGKYALLDEVIGSLVEEFRARGDLNEKPFVYTPDAGPKGALAFPGKVLADAAGGRLFVSDSNHDRVIVADLAGRVQRVIGGTRGFADGAAGAARFHGPQGLALADRDTLLVADTLNHAVRRIDLRSGAVTTLIGTGQRAYLRDDDYAPRAVALNTPWDLAVVGKRLFVAMAGQHQVWSFDLADPGARFERFAGTGHERLLDGPRLDAGLNQPSGLASDGSRLYIADSEASAVRVVPVAGEGRLSTVVGMGLFEFGDTDGVGDAVRLQHALGVAWSPDRGSANGGGRLFIADTYNGKLKALDPRTRSVTTLAGGLDEPGGVSVAQVDGATRIYLADTNHHAIKVYDLATRKLTELPLTGL